MRVVTARIGIGEVITTVIMAVVTIGLVIGLLNINHDHKSTLDEIKKVNGTVVNMDFAVGGFKTDENGRIIVDQKGNPVDGSGLVWQQYQTQQQISGVKTDIAAAKASADAAKTDVESLRAKMAEGFQSLKDEIGKVPKAVAEQPATLDNLVTGLNDFSAESQRVFASKIVAIGKDGGKEGADAISKMIILLPNKKAQWILEKIGNNALPSLVAAFDNADANVREAAKQVVVKIGGTEALEKLTEVMSRGSEMAKALAFQAYAEIKGYATKPIIPTPAAPLPGKPAAPSRP